MNIVDIARLSAYASRSVSGPLCESVITGLNTCFESVVRPVYEGAGANVLVEGRVVDPEAPIFKAIAEQRWDTTGDLDSDYPVFMASMLRTKHPGSLTVYTLEGYRERGARLYKVAGYDAGFAIAGDGDIISVHNNSDYANVAPAMLDAAKQLGGNHLDHFDFDRLNKVYGDAGFAPYGTLHWDDQYAPKQWDYDKDGRPDVILRALPGYQGGQSGDDV